MSRIPLLRALISLAALSASAFFVLTTPPQLGLDLKGGTQLVLQTEDSDVTKADAAATDRTLEVLRRRVDALGVAEPSLARSGERRIIVELPGLQDPTQAAEVVGRTAQLRIHPVLGIEGDGAVPDEQGTPVLLGPAALTGEAVSGASPQAAQFGAGWNVVIEFNGAGDRAWERLTAEAACAPPGTAPRRVAIVLDDEVISSPQVDPSVGCGVGIPGGSTQITGDFSNAEAEDLSALISGGALPVPVEIIEQRVVGPTLGEEAIDASAKAGLIGLTLTALFLLVTYRLAGLLATLGLAAFALISFGALSALGATLTLPGLAGLLLSAGLAIDANVLVFERAREEQSGRTRSLPRTLRAGYRHAWSAIADSNATTLLAAGLLFYLASGPVRGFGVTLAVGVAASMLSALVVCRSLTDLAIRKGTPPGLSGLARPGRVRTWLVRRDPHLIQHRRRWLALSAVVLVVAGVGIAQRGLDLGVEFTGGRLIEYATGATPDSARAAVADAGFPRAIVQSSGAQEITVRGSSLDEPAIRAALAQLGGGVDVVRDETIGPSLGDELRTKALIALALAVAAQLAYLAFRFTWSYAAGAVLAMVHDVVLVVGFFAWTGRIIDSVFVAALLAVIGLSVNDTIVTLDRVRELRKAAPDDPLPRTCDRAILQTAPRTINTGLGAMLILASLVVLGGDSLQDFAIALLIGLVVGTYSSAFTALPLVLELEREPVGAEGPAAAGGAPAHHVKV